MPKLDKLNYRTWDGDEQVLDFIGSLPLEQGFHTTILTGRNGSHKSTILRELVSELAVPQHSGRLQLATGFSRAGHPVNVICASGSVADRFPPKESGGRYTEFSVPSYVYLGQRVGTNLLSKKQPLETAVAFALDKSVRDRFHWPFYSRACRFAGIKPRLDLTFLTKASAKQAGDLWGVISSVAAADWSNAEGPKHGRSLSPAVARYLLNEFPREDFMELEQIVRGRTSGRIRLILGEGGPESQSGGLGAIRLGLLANVLSLQDARVSSNGHKKTFSAFDLSSGEYHMLTTIVGLGFSVKPEAVVLIDEPENSLHPQWQQEFMGALFEICDFIRDGHVVISTHSPLIVSSVRPGSTVVDLARADEPEAVTADLYGASADDILFEQFGIASSRNRKIIDVVQRGVDLIERGQRNSVDFEEMEGDLRVLRERLRDNDPLVDVIDAMLEVDR
ncbi:ATP-binding protein [Lysobacter sp. ESA13C]|uniref:ATP-binding protein n=1 Tax=Lysobacter sp. ESA13C TaxID=2862676 RepID=UPI001CBF98C4|nr:ATP-binding protein [Lysobacter sp. ESA13C]